MPLLSQEEIEQRLAGSDVESRGRTRSCASWSSPTSPPRSRSSNRVARARRGGQPPPRHPRARLEQGAPDAVHALRGRAHRRRLPARRARSTACWSAPPDRPTRTGRSRAFRVAIALARLARRQAMNDDEELPRSSVAPMGRRAAQRPRACGTRAGRSACTRHSGVNGLKLILAAVLVAINAFFVIAEYALVRSRRARLELMREEGAKGAGLALEQLATSTSTSPPCRSA